MLTRDYVIKKLVRDIAIIVGSAVICLTLILFINVGMNSTIDSVVAKKQLNTSLGIRSNVVAQLHGQYLQVAGSGARIRSALLPSSNVLEFVTSLESLAAKDNVAQSVHFDIPRDSGATLGDPIVAVQQIAFSESIQGNIFTFIQFLKDMERLPYFMKLDGMTIAGSADGGWQNTSTVTLQGTLYTQSDTDTL
jgi:hypothetical protein